MSPVPAPTANPAKANLAAASEETAHTESAAKPAKRMEKKPYTGERHTSRIVRLKMDYCMILFFAHTTARKILLSADDTLCYLLCAQIEI